MQSAKSPKLNNFELDTCPILVAIDQPFPASCKYKCNYSMRLSNCLLAGIFLLRMSYCQDWRTSASKVPFTQYFLE